ncbi:Rhodanese-like domain-containing protein [Mycena amicta]|nr:Rhodanese-like domain-containing protein [Mycena amicta]
MSSLLLSPTRLHQLIRSQSKVVVLDSTWFMPNSSRVAKSEFKAKRIAGSRFLDLDELASTHELGLKHMMPSAQMFRQACGEKFGIEPSSHVVLYDTHGVFSSPRALWMFKSFGHQNASILDGGLPRWESEDFPLTGGPDPSQPATVEYPLPSLDPNVVRSYEQIVANSAQIPLQTPGAELVVDARSRGRFLGSDPEPRPGLSSGHIPNSYSLPFNVFLQNNTAPNGSTYSTFLTEDKLRTAVVDALGPERAQAVFRGNVPVIASCGSGMTAAILWLGLQLLGVNKISIYDESWTGYGLRPSSVIEKSV